MKVLFIGNSFSVDIVEYAVDVAKNLEIEMKIGNLYFPSCSLNMHLSNITENTAPYTYYENDGDGWSKTPNVSIATAMKQDAWEIICIFPGTGDGSLHTTNEAYENLPKLLERVKELALPEAKYAFPLTWISDKDKQKKDLALYHGDQTLVMNLIADRLRSHVIASGAFWRIIPTGTAVQHARNAGLCITRDGYHLSYGMGRLMGALTVVGAFTDADISKATWMPEGVTEEERDQAIRFAQRALLDPFTFSL